MIFIRPDLDHVTFVRSWMNTDSHVHTETRWEVSGALGSWLKRENVSMCIKVTF